MRLDFRTATRASPSLPAEGWDPNLLGEKQSPHKENYEPHTRHTESQDLVIRSEDTRQEQGSQWSQPSGMKLGREREYKKIVSTRNLGR